MHKNVLESSINFVSLVCGSGPLPSSTLGTPLFSVSLRMSAIDVNWTVESRRAGHPFRALTDVPNVTKLYDKLYSQRNMVAKRKKTSKYMLYNMKK